MSITYWDSVGIMGIVAAFVSIIALLWRNDMGITLLFFIIVLCMVVCYGVIFLVRPAKHFESKILNMVAGNTASIVATIGVAITVIILGSTVMKRLVISGIAVVACWLILFPNFIRREFGRSVVSRFDTGANPPWTDVVYGAIGVVMFIGALVMQHYLVDNAAAE